MLQAPSRLVDKLVQHICMAQKIPKKTWWKVLTICNLRAICHQSTLRGATTKSQSLCAKTTAVLVVDLGMAASSTQCRSKHWVPRSRRMVTSNSLHWKSHEIYWNILKIKSSYNITQSLKLRKLRNSFVQQRSATTQYGCWTVRHDSEARPRPWRCCSCRCLGCRSGTCFVQAQSTGDLQSCVVYPKASFKKMLYLDNKSNKHQNTHAQLVLNCCLNMASKKSEPFFIWRILISRHACFIFFSTPRYLKHISI